MVAIWKLCVSSATVNVGPSFFTRPSDDEPGAVFGPPPTSSWGLNLWVIESKTTRLHLLLIPNYFDVALRDFGLSLGALALARLSREFSSR